MGSCHIHREGQVYAQLSCARVIFNSSLQALNRFVELLAPAIDGLNSEVVRSRFQSFTGRSAPNMHNFNAEARGILRQLSAAYESYDALEAETNKKITKLRSLNDQAQAALVPEYACEIPLSVAQKQSFAYIWSQLSEKQRSVWKANRGYQYENGILKLVAPKFSESNYPLNGQIEQDIANLREIAREPYYDSDRNVVGSLPPLLRNAITINERQFNAAHARAIDGLSSSKKSQYEQLMPQRDVLINEINGTTGNPGLSERLGDARRALSIKQDELNRKMLSLRSMMHIDQETRARSSTHVNQSPGYCRDFNLRPRTP